MTERMQDEMVSDLVSGGDGGITEYSNERKQKIVLSGYYGFGNTGDELILSGILSDLRKRVQEIEFTVLSGDPIRTSKLHGVNAVLFNDLENVRKAIAGSDLVLIGGGGILFDAYNNTYLPERILSEDYFGLSYYATVLLLSHLYHVPSMFYAVGVGPLITAETRDLLISMFDLCSGISVRDQRSREIILSFIEKHQYLMEKIVLASDPAFSIDTETISDNECINFESFEKDRKKLAVSLRYWDFGQAQSAWEQETAYALDALVAEDDYYVVFIPFQANKGRIIEDDYEVCERVRNCMANQSAVYLHKDKLTIHQCISMLKSCDAVLGMRYHSVLLALKEGIPVVGLEYDPKLRSIFAEYDQLDHLLVQPWKRETITAAVRSSKESADANKWRRQTLELETRAQISADLAVKFMRSDHDRDLPGEKLLKNIVIQKIRSLLDAKEQLQHIPVLEQQVTGLKEHLNRNSVEIQNLQARLDENIEENEYLLTEVEKKSADIRRITSNLEQCQNENSILTRKTAEQKAGLRDAENKKSELYNEIDMISAKLNRIEADLSNANNELHEIHTSRYWKVLGIYWRAVNLIKNCFSILKRN